MCPRRYFNNVGESDKFNSTEMRVEIFKRLDDGSIVPNEWEESDTQYSTKLICSNCKQPYRVITVLLEEEDEENLCWVCEALAEVTSDENVQKDLENEGLL